MYSGPEWAFERIFWSGFEREMSDCAAVNAARARIGKRESILEVRLEG